LVAGLPGAGSIAELPQAPPQPWVAPRPGVPAGKVTTQEFTSQLLKNQHQVWTYLPAGYDPKAKPYPLLICFFGGMFVNRNAVSAPTTLDNLIAAHRVPPMVGIFIDDPKGEGNEELRNHRSFLNFMADEVYPWAHKQWNVT